MTILGDLTVDAPADLVWRIYSDIEHWPDWTDSVRTVRFLEGEAISVRARVEIKQPRLPLLEWVVTEVEDGRAWTWVASSLGSTTLAHHLLVPLDDSSTRVEQRIEHSGVLGRRVGALLEGQTRRYLDMEGRGLKLRCEARAAAG